MADAPNYKAEVLSVDSIEIFRLTDAANRMEVSIAPSIGNIAYDFQVGGQHVLQQPPQNLADWKAKPSQAGIPFLAPWANRLDSESFWANGSKFSLNPEVVTLRRDPNGLPIHGLLLFAADWHIARWSADAQGAEVSCRLEFWRHPEWMAQFPFAHTIEITHRLSEGALEVRTSIENFSGRPIPLSIGLHPWFQLPDCSRDEWTVHLPVGEHYTLSDKLIPTGETEPVAFPSAMPLAGHKLDDVFGHVNTSDEFWVECNGRRISVRFGSKFPIAVVYAPLDNSVICFEPMTAITNAFNLAHAGIYRGLQHVPAGGTWTESFWIRPTGF